MAIRYFKKPTNAPNPSLGNGSSTTFNTLDNLVSYFATDNEYVQQSLLGMMSSGSGGVTEISAEEFVRDYLEPKKNGVQAKPLWREEVGKGVGRGIPVMQQLGAERVQAIAGVAAGKPGAVGAPVVAEPTAPAAAPTPELRSQVKVGKRTGKSKADKQQSS